MNFSGKNLLGFSILALFKDLSTLLEGLESSF